MKLCVTSWIYSGFGLASRQLAQCAETPREEDPLKVRDSHQDRSLIAYQNLVYRIMMGDETEDDADTANDELMADDPQSQEDTGPTPPGIYAGLSPSNFAEFLSFD